MKSDGDHCGSNSRIGSSVQEFPGVFEDLPAPSLVVSARNFAVVAANRSARKLLGERCLERARKSLPECGVSEYGQKFMQTVSRCSVGESEIGTCSFTFLTELGLSLHVDMVVSGMGPVPGRGPLVVVQMRDSSAKYTLNTFTRLAINGVESRALMASLVEGPLSRYPVNSVLLYEADREKETIHLRAAHGWDEASQKEYGNLPLTRAIPSGAACLDGELLWMSVRSMAERFPLVAARARLSNVYETGEIIALPLTVRGSIVGSFVLTVSGPMEQTVARIDDLSTVAHLLAAWVALTRPGETRSLVGRTVSHQFDLAPRELRVLSMVDSGYTNLRIADELGYSEATVRADLARVSKMLGVQGRREVVNRAKELGLYPG